MHRQHGVPLAVNVGDAMNAMSVRAPEAEPVAARARAQRAHLRRVRSHVDRDHRRPGAWSSAGSATTTAAPPRTTTSSWCSRRPAGTASFTLRASARSSPARSGPISTRFNRFGYYLGTAFQIQDDVLNLVGDARKYGKEIGGDLLEGKRTLILAHLFKSAQPGREGAPADVPGKAARAATAARGGLDLRAAAIARQHRVRPPGRARLRGRRAARIRGGLRRRRAGTGPRLRALALLDYMVSREA